MRDTGRCWESVVLMVVRGHYDESVVVAMEVIGCNLQGNVSGCYGSYWLLRWFTGCYAKPAVANERL
jgi:hypothetical protein